MSHPSGSEPQPGARRYRPGSPPPAAARAWSELDRAQTRVMPATGDARGAPPVRPGGPGGPAGRGGGRTPGWLIGGRIVSALLAVLVLIGAGLGSLWNIQGTSSATKGAQQAAPAGEGMNILLIGSDSRTNADGSPLSADELKKVATEASSGVNTDTIMVLHIPGGGGRATAVSLPRDTWVDQDNVRNLPGPYSSGSQGDYKPNKINAFYGTAKAFTQEYLVTRNVGGAERELRSSEAGRKMLIQVVSRFTGLHIDHFAEVNLIAFYTISGAIGGVPVCLNKAVKDPMSGADFKAGRQEIQGTAALSFVRQRHGLPNGDLDRVRRQQAFLGGAIKKVLSQPTTIPGLVAAAKKSLVMDSDLDLATLAVQMKDLSSGNVTFVTIPTHGQAAAAGTDALATDPAEIKAFFAGLDHPGTPPSSADPSTAAKNLRVDVQNGTMTAGMGKSVASVLSRAGLSVTDPGDMPGKSRSHQLAATEVRFHTGEQTYGTKVKQALGYGKVRQDADVAAGHVLVVVGTDAPAPGEGLRSTAGALQPPTPDPARAQAPQPAQAPAAGTGSAGPVSAASVGCVN